MRLVLLGRNSLKNAVAIGIIGIGAGLDLIDQVFVTTSGGLGTREKVFFFAGAAVAGEGAGEGTDFDLGEVGGG